MAASALSLSSLSLSLSVPSSSSSSSSSSSAAAASPSPSLPSSLSFPKSSLFASLPASFLRKPPTNLTRSFHVRAAAIPAEGKVGAVEVEEDEEEETPEEIRKAYEDLYGPAFSRLSVKKSSAEDDGFGAAKRSGKDRNPKDNMEEKVVQVRRVTKVVKGGKQLSFRAIVVVGDKQGRVGVGVGKAKEVIIAVQKASYDARRHLISVPMTKQKTFPHRAEGKFGAAKVMLRPAAVGTGVIAGGSVRTVLELAGVVNGMGKELGSKNPLNNARAVIEAISSMRQFREVAEKRGIPMEVLWQ